MKQLEDALASSRIDEAQVRAWVSDLEKLGSKHSSEFRACVNGRAAAQRAKALEQFPNRNWDDILAVWNEAVTAEPTNTEYQAAQQSADKQRAYSRMSALSLEDQIVEM